MEKLYSEIHPSNKIHETAIIYDNVNIGVGNIIGAYTVIGSNGEIRGAKEFLGVVNIGSNNVISEHVTIQRPEKEGKSTDLGNNNIVMAHSHLGHDSKVGNNVEICTGTILGGYSTIKDGCRLKIGSLIRNRITVGTNSIVGMGSVVVSDIKNNEVVVGNPAKKLK